MARASKRERMLAFRAYLSRYEARTGLSHAEAMREIARRLNRSPETLYQWLMQNAETDRPVPWAMLDVLLLEERLRFGEPITADDISAFYSMPQARNNAAR